MAEKRSAFMHFINTTPGGETDTYAMIGKGVTELSVSYNPQTTTEQYVNEDSANTEITGYQPNAPVTAQAIKSDDAFKFVNSIRKKQAIGSDAYTDIILVDAFEAPVDGAYPAIRQDVSVQIDSYGGPATDPLSIGYTLNWRGTGVEGTFDPSTKTFKEGVSPAPASYSVSKSKDLKVEV